MSINFNPNRQAANNAFKTPLGGSLDAATASRAQNSAEGFGQLFNNPSAPKFINPNAGRGFMGIG